MDCLKFLLLIEKGLKNVSFYKEKEYSFIREVFLENKIIFGTVSKIKEI